MALTDLNNAREAMNTAVTAHAADVNPTTLGTAINAAAAFSREIHATRVSNPSTPIDDLFSNPEVMNETLRDHVEDVFTDGVADPE